MLKPIILGIETSCDETSVAVLSGSKILAHVTSSQISQHLGFGGVFPELASRLHTENITYVLAQAMATAQLTYGQIDAIAVTQGPGLIGALHIGLQAAKVIAAVHQKPLIGVHHHAAHLEAARFIAPIQYPALGLIISGGHTELIYLKQPLDYELIGQTQDDAVGESFDKVARMMGLGYPGGPLIEQLAQSGTSEYRLPTPVTAHPFDFSFSGLKTAVFQLLQQHQQKQHNLNKANLAYAFQKIVIDTLVNKTTLAAKKYSVQSIVIGGGVSLNQALRNAFKDVEKSLQIPILFPPAWACTDNAAMIALLGQVMFEQGIISPLSIGADPSWDLPTFSKK
jgi:N6-L-threonylcarbamoyladenine synthase